MTFFKNIYDKHRLESETKFQLVGSKEYKLHAYAHNDHYVFWFTNESITNMKLLKIKAITTFEMVWANIKLHKNKWLKELSGFTILAHKANCFK